MGSEDFDLCLKSRRLDAWETQDPATLWWRSLIQATLGKGETFKGIYLLSARVASCQQLILQRFPRLLGCFKNQLFIYFSYSLILHQIAFLGTLPQGPSCAKDLCHSGSKIGLG